MNNNRLIVAAAGSGKTTRLVEEALKIGDSHVLLTTFTEQNALEIRNRVVEKNGCVAGNITIQTWFSVLLQHGVRPFQGYCYPHDIQGLNLVNGQSARYAKEGDIGKHYFDEQRRIYSDKVAKLLLKCNRASGGKVINRLARLYPFIFIDEVQDLAAYDLDLLRLLFASTISVFLVGDPRQATYSTSDARRNAKFKKSAILNFFEENSTIVEKDDQSLKTNHRSNAAITSLSNSIFPDYPPTESGPVGHTGHDGIFLVLAQDVDTYLTLYQPMQLRDSRNTKISNEQPCMNFGQSKGLSFDRVLIFPTDPIRKWLKDNRSDLAPTSRSKLYVAVTRARYSVAFVYDYKENERIENMQKFGCEA